jgi:uncharacterized membrane protein YgcG
MSTRYFVLKKRRKVLTVGVNVQKTKKRMKSSYVEEAEMCGFAVQVANGAQQEQSHNHRDQIRQIFGALGTGTGAGFSCHGCLGGSCRNRGGSSGGGGLGGSLRWSVVGSYGFARHVVLGVVGFCFRDVGLVFGLQLKNREQFE